METSSIREPQTGSARACRWAALMTSRLSRSGGSEFATGARRTEYLHLLDQRGEGSEAMSVVQGLFGSLNSATHNTTVSQGQLDSARAQLVGLITGSAPDVAEPTPPNSWGIPPTADSTGAADQQADAPPVTTGKGPNARILRVKVPRSVKRLSRVGVRALVRCTSPAARVNLDLDRQSACRPSPWPANLANRSRARGDRTAPREVGASPSLAQSSSSTHTRQDSGDDPHQDFDRDAPMAS